MTKTATTKPAKPTAKAPRADERNGIKPPTRAGVVMQIWMTYEAMPNLTSADIAKLAEEAGWSVGLARSWFRQHCAYHGKPTTRATKAAR